MFWYPIVGINPEPWAIGTINKHGISPNQNLKTYQNAVREDLEGQRNHAEFEEISLVFLFWRQIETYLDLNDKIRTRKAVDATNLQKGLEDALQGVLFKNDRCVQDVRSVIVQQSSETRPGILIGLESSRAETRNESVTKLGIPHDVSAALNRGNASPAKNAWYEEENLF